MDAVAVDAKVDARNCVPPPTKRVAILYQALPPPTLRGLRKPFKPGGYTDSGADIAHALRGSGVDVATPVANPDARIDRDWVFADTAEGMAMARAAGANVLWANTVLFREHPIAQLMHELWLVGQRPADVETFDDKWETNEFLRAAGCDVARSVLISAAPGPDAIDIRVLDSRRLADCGLDFPLVLKPVRGRGSQDVSVAENFDELLNGCHELLGTRPQQGAAAEHPYGDSLMVEEFLAGEELTITVMPPGRYAFGDEFREREHYWPLPPVRRFNHRRGIAPYNGAVAVINNSVVLESQRHRETPVRRLLEHCIHAAELVNPPAPIRIDCRAAADGGYKLFDLNMKPNMTGAGRPGREDQDNLSGVAARAIGWSYAGLLLNMLQQAWKLPPYGAASGG